MTDTTFEFPILVYQEDGLWVAHSLMTGTVAVCDSAAAAAAEVCELIDGELEDAFEQSDGDLAAALASIESTPPVWMVRAFFRGSRKLEPGSACRRLAPARDIGMPFFPVRQTTLRPATC